MSYYRSIVIGSLSEPQLSSGGNVQLVDASLRGLTDPQIEQVPIVPSVK